jgi:hypothetical protein
MIQNFGNRSSIKNASVVELFFVEYRAKMVFNLIFTVIINKILETYVCENLV